MDDSGKKLVESAKRFASDRDEYDGISYEAPPLAPDNILVFTRTALREQDCANAGHRHHRHALVIFIRKPGWVIVERSHLHVREGEAFLLYPFQQHYYAVPPEGILWLFISFDLPETQAIRSFPQPVKVSASIQDMLFDLLEVYRTGSAQEASVSLSRILYAMQAGSGSPQEPMDPDKEMIAKINTYIHQHLGEPFTLQTVARQCGFSTNYVSLRFKKTMGIALGRYVRSVRLNHAADLLRRTSLTVSEIAYRSGFSSPAVFCRAFKNERGISALNFRGSGGS